MYMEKKTCQHCKQELVFEKQGQFGAHVVNCKSNPKRQERLDKIKESLKNIVIKTKLCDKCNEHFSLQNFHKHYNVCGNQKNKIRYKHRAMPEWSIGNNQYKCPHCSKIFKRIGIGMHIFLQHTEEGKAHKIKIYTDKNVTSKMGWARGLTKETDERVKKTSKALSEKYKNGTITHKYLGKKLSKEHRANLSESHSKFLEEKGAYYGQSFLHVKHYKVTNINGVEYMVRGTWEVKTAEWLNNHNILWERRIYLKYNKDEVTKTYTPDFYLPEHNL